MTTDSGSAPMRHAADRGRSAVLRRGCGSTLSAHRRRSPPVAPVGRRLRRPAPARSRRRAAAPVPPPPAAAAATCARSRGPGLGQPPPPAWSAAPPRPGRCATVSPPPTWSAPSPVRPTSPQPRPAPAKPLVTIGSVNVTPKMAAIAGIALAAIIVVVYFVSSGSKSGGITVTPSTYSCSSTALVTAVMRLPASVQATDAFSSSSRTGRPSIQPARRFTFRDMFTHQTDGSWTYTYVGSRPSRTAPAPVVRR